MVDSNNDFRMRTEDKVYESETSVRKVAYLMPTRNIYVCWKPVKLRLLPHVSMKEIEVAA